MVTYCLISTFLGYWLAMAGSIGLEGITFCILTNLTNWNKQITKVSQEEVGGGDGGQCTGRVL